MPPAPRAADQPLKKSFGWHLAAYHPLLLPSFIFFSSFNLGVATSYLGQNYLRTNKTNREASCGSSPTHSELAAQEWQRA